MAANAEREGRFKPARDGDRLTDRKAGGLVLRTAVDTVTDWMMEIDAQDYLNITSGVGRQLGGRGCRSPLIAREQFGGYYGVLLLFVGSGQALEITVFS